jgi:hypothetical protein
MSEISRPTPPSSSTANNLVAEGLIDLNEAAGDCKDARGRKPHIATLRRWAKNGCRGHKLETAFLGNRLMTTHQAVFRFLAAINGRPVPTILAPTTSAAEKAGRELTRLLK